MVNVPLGVTLNTVPITAAAANPSRAVEIAVIAQRQSLPTDYAPLVPLKETSVVNVPLVRHLEHRAITVAAAQRSGAIEIDRRVGFNFKTQIISLTGQGRHLLETAPEIKDSRLVPSNAAGELVMAI